MFQVKLEIILFKNFQYFGDLRYGKSQAHLKAYRLFLKT